MSCHDCECREGQIHELGCDVERCPFCGGQLITCECCYTTQGIDPDKEPTYSEGLNEKQKATWMQKLNEKGRIPFIEYPNICIRCGKLYPKMFDVSNDEWNKYVEPRMRSEMLCLACYEYIKKVIDKETKR